MVKFLLDPGFQKKTTEPFWKACWRDRETSVSLCSTLLLAHSIICPWGVLADLCLCSPGAQPPLISMMALGLAVHTSILPIPENGK